MFFNTLRPNPRSNHSGSGPAVPSVMLNEYYTVWGESLATLAASYGVEPRQIAGASGISPYWHHLAPLPPGTKVLIPFTPVPHRVVMGVSQDTRTDPRGPLAGGGKSLTLAQSRMPYPYGV